MDLPRQLPAQKPCKAAVLQLIEKHSAQYHESEHNFLGVTLDICQIHAVLNDADYQRANECPEDSSLAATETRATDYNCGNHIQLVTGTVSRSAAFQLRGHYYATEACQRSADCIHRPLDKMRAYSSQTCGLGIPADCIDIPAKCCPRHDDVSRGIQNCHQDDRIGNSQERIRPTSQPDKAVGNLVDGNSLEMM